FRAALSPLEANVAALALTMVFNFAANRWLTFRANNGPLARQAAQYVVAYVVGMGASSGAFALALAAFSNPDRRAETLLALASGLLATVVRFVLMSAWVFRSRLEAVRA